MALARHTSSRSVYCSRGDGSAGVKSLGIVRTVRRGFQGRCGVSEAKCFLPRKERKRKPPERGEEIDIQQASDDCQAVLHCRCDADIHSSFSPLHRVIPLLSFPLLSSLLSFPSSSRSLSSPCLLSPLSALSVGIFPITLSTFSLFPFSSLHLSISPLLSSSLNPLRRDEWVE